MIVTETDRLLLRHFHMLDVDAMQSVFGDAEVMHYGPGVQTILWIREWLHSCRSDYYRKLGFGPYAVVEKSSGRVFGYCGLFYFPDISGQPEIEIGYRLAREFWGKGYATEAALAVRDYGFHALSLTRLIALIDPENAASRRVAEKIGMMYEKEVMLPDYTHPDHLYAITAALTPPP